MAECSRREARAQMTDEEFWADVFPMDDHGDPEPDDDVEVLSLGATPCPVCGSTIECGVDSLGRPMIHTTIGDLDV